MLGERDCVSKVAWIGTELDRLIVCAISSDAVHGLAAFQIDDTDQVANNIFGK